MKKASLSILLILCIAGAGMAQKTESRHEMLYDAMPDSAYKNICIKALYSDTLVSTFLIWIKHKVPAHLHQYHTEQVLILEGKAEMWVNHNRYQVKAGDWIVLPPNCSHAVKVKSRKPLKVLSIQAPEFNGKDRLLVGGEGVPVW